MHAVSAPVRHSLSITYISSQLTSTSFLPTPTAVRFENGLEAPEPNSDQWRAMPALGDPKTRFHVGA